MTEIAKGSRWKFNTLNPNLISYSTLPPVWQIVVVSHIDDREVFYRYENQSLTRQTSIERFKEIAIKSE